MTSNTRFRPDFSSGRIDVPDVGGILTEFADRQANIADKGLDRAIKQQQLDEEQRRWDITNARAEALAKRQEDEYNRALSEKNATNEAYRVLMNKDQYANEKMTAEQKAIQETLAMLTPEERAEAEQGLKTYYNPEVSRQQWIDNAISGPNVDQSKVLAMKTDLYNIAANTPGTPEYQAKIDADREQKKWALDLENRYKMAQLATENKNRLAQIEASKEAKPVGQDLFYAPNGQGGYRPVYVPKGSDIGADWMSESIYKASLGKINEDSGGSGGSGSGKNKNDYNPFEVASKLTPDKEQQGSIGKGLNTIEKLMGKNTAERVTSLITPGNDNWNWNTPAKINPTVFENAFGDDKVTINGVEVKAGDFYVDALTNPDKYIAVTDKSGKTKVYTKDSQAAKILDEVNNKPSINKGSTLNTEILKPTSKTNASEYNQQGYNPIINFSNSSSPIAERVNKEYSAEAIKANADRSKKLEDAYLALVPKELRNNISLSRYSATDKEALNDYISLYNKLDNQTKKLLTYDKYLENKSFYDSRLK